MSVGAWMSDVDRGETVCGWSVSMFEKGRGRNVTKRSRRSRQVVL